LSGAGVENPRESWNGRDIPVRAWRGREGRGLSLLGRGGATRLGAGGGFGQPGGEALGMAGWWAFGLLLFGVAWWVVVRGSELYFRQAPRPLPWAVHLPAIVLMFVPVCL